ncbi:hypothetical protein EDD22DRAFT_979169 [Suillus occidentalis]|nr:hypothetical protein EDD22DRAFT_979169 [Suillus occidentalis]
MSLDQNLFTLLLTPNTSDPSGLVTDLTDPSGNVSTTTNNAYPGKSTKSRCTVHPISESLLASATSPSATSKHKTIELYNPTKEHEFEWKREECFMIRKPDPPVMVAVTKEPPGRIKTASVQILDYNLNRFDIDDRKGLEIVILTALLTFQDASDSYHEPSNDSNTTTSARKSLTARKASGGTAPVPPPKLAPKKGVERVAEIQASTGRGEANEVFIVDECSFKDYAQYCARMQDEAMLFISIRSAGAPQVPKVLQVVEETKRIRHKAGDKDLHQYVLKGPKSINLDDHKDKAKGKDYIPPSNIVVHLGKIDMPELRTKERWTRRSIKSANKGWEEQRHTEGQGEESKRVER